MAIISKTINACESEKQNRPYSLKIYIQSSPATALQDLDGDNVLDIAVGAPSDDDGGANNGAVWVLFLNRNGTVKSYQKISDSQGNFTGNLSNGDLFGFSIASTRDLDGDKVTDMVVGAIGDNDGGGNRGAVWVLFLTGVSVLRTK